MVFSILDIVMGWPASIKEAGKVFPKTIVSRYATKTESHGRLDILSDCLSECCTYSNMHPTSYIYIDQALDHQDVVRKLPAPSPTDSRSYVLYVHPTLIDELWPYALSLHKTLEKMGYLACIRYPKDFQEDSDLFVNIVKHRSLYTTDGKYADILRIVRSVHGTDFYETV